LAGKKETSKSGFSKKIKVYTAIGLIAVATISIVLFRNNNNNSPLSSNPVEDSKKAAIERFQMVFCGLDAKPNSNEFITEYKLPKPCEMPLGIAVDNDNLWYISTKNGTLGVYTPEQNKFNKEIPIPVWKSRLNPIDFSQVWSVKVDGRGSVWFTDEKQNAIWRYNKSSQIFEMYKVPVKSDIFGTTYPVSLDFDSKGNIYFVGIRSTSLWFGNVTKMKNGTSEGISGIPMPTGRFAGIDQSLISTGSVAVDNKRNAVWISMLAFQKKGQILRYDINTKGFKIFDMPEELTSPVGIAIDDSGNSWVTDHGTSIFYRLDSSTGKITKFATSKASPRIFGSNKTPEGAYTLPYWIEKGTDGSLWFNEHTGNKIGRFNPANMTLVEYWIPTQNKLFGLCNPGSQTCGIGNVLQFSVGQNNQVWFTEWSEDKIGRVDTQKHLPFSVSTPIKELTIKKGESAEIKVTINTPSNENVNMTASGTFTPTGGLGNSTGSFSEESFSIAAGKPKQVSFIFTPSVDLKPGDYMLMIGAENDAISYIMAVKINLI
jgi:virginiamycin B lyase